ncbi:MAG: hypothetical protein RBT25_02800 [Lentisphaeria bacterium]|nr:hypothetical protein [Lentisphaeria bacterium]
MAKKERNYEFRKRLNQVHRNRLNPARNRPQAGELRIDESWQIHLAADAGDYLFRVAQDLQDYFAVSQGLALLLKHGVQPGENPQQPAIVIGTAAEFPDAAKALKTPRSFYLCAERQEIMLCGKDERGAAQACYYLEDLLNLRQAPYIQEQSILREPLFSPRMVHSGWGLDQFPDPHLNAIAHAGMDAILVFVKDLNMSCAGFLDFNELIERAASFGLDVYFYSYMKSRRHPEDADAVEFYENSYGRLIRACPKVKGLVFVGESCEFPSRDERSKGRLRLDPVPPGQEDDPRPFPGWWPCRDYPQWLQLLKGIMRKYNPGLDIVFWTYNWGWAPVEDRLALIRQLPGDISLQVTFEMFENIEKDGVPTRCVDYTASFSGPGSYFRSEAKQAKAMNMALYAMSNTGGLTWDIGVIPYQPIPFQWKKRWDALLAARRDWGLVGLMESHHYGWWPSFISVLCKEAYWSNALPFTEHLHLLAKCLFGSQGAQLAVEAWRAWSSAAQDYVPTNEDQYGPFRVGPAYPLLFLEDERKLPDVPHAHFGARIVKTPYVSHDPAIVPGEIALLQSMAKKMRSGILLMEEALKQTPALCREEAESIARLGKFMLCCVQTTINVKKWFLCNQVLLDTGAAAPEKLLAYKQMEVLLSEERDNVLAALPLVSEDSRLGWEPSMEYMCDPEHLHWKLQILQDNEAKLMPEYHRQLLKEQ